MTKLSFIFVSILACRSAYSQSANRDYEKCLDKICAEAEKLTLFKDKSAVFQQLSDTGRGPKTTGSWEIVGDSLVLLSRGKIQSTYIIKYALGSELLVLTTELNEWTEIKNKLIAYSEKDSDYLQIKSDNSWESTSKERALRGLIGIFLAKVCGEQPRDIYFKK